MRMHWEGGPRQNMEGWKVPWEFGKGNDIELKTFFRVQNRAIVCRASNWLIFKVFCELLERERCMKSGRE